MSIKGSLKRRFPWLTPIYSHLIWNLAIRPRMRMQGMAGVFAQIYRTNGWGSLESVSGEGSTLEQTAAIRNALPEVIAELEINSMLDIPCGDFNWMTHLELPVKYTGADIVEELVDRNQRAYANGNRTFQKGDLCSDLLPTVDLILCRDCLVHLSFCDIDNALRNIKRSRSRFLLTTTHTSVTENIDIVTGEWRPINLEAPPFMLPAPIKLIDEKCQNTSSAGKHLGLWRIQDLSV